MIYSYMATGKYAVALILKWDRSLVFKAIKFKSQMKFDKAQDSI